MMMQPSVEFDKLFKTYAELRSSYSSKTETAREVSRRFGGKPGAKTIVEHVMNHGGGEEAVLKEYGGSLPQCDSSQALDSLPEKKIEEKSVERELRSEIRALHKTVDEQRKQLLSQEELVNAMSRWLPSFPVVTPPKIKYSPSKTEAIANVLWSDFHCNRTVSYLETEGFGEYNEEIFCARLYHMIKKTVHFTEIQRNEHNVKKLWICELGDAINDDSRPENVRTNIAPNLIAVVRFVSPIAQGIRILLNHFETIDIDWHCGNEGRTTIKLPSKFRTDNWDYLCGVMLKLILAEEIRRGRIVFRLPVSWSSIVTQMGWRFLLSHGNDVKGSVWGISEYGLRRWEDRQHKMRRPNKRHPERLDFDKWYHGHFHTFYEIEDRIGNGALTGTDEYAYSKSLSGDPIQGLTFITDKHCDTSWSKLNLYDASGHPFEIMEEDDIVDQLWKFDKKLVAGL